MLTVIPRLLGTDELSRLHAIVDEGEWIDGNATSGHQASLMKNNRQLADTSEAARQGGQLVLDALGRNPLFIAAALPLKICPPMFNSYADGQGYGMHVDNAMRIAAGTDCRARSDLSMTVFLEPPDAYDGGELAIETPFGAQKVKLPAGDAVLYPSSSLHRVEPVTRGRRVAGILWLQSMVRDAEARASLFDLDQSIQALAVAAGQDDPALVRLTGLYHNLMRRWADS